MPVQPFLKKDSSLNGTCFYLQLITYVHLPLQTIIPFLGVKVDIHFILMLVTDLEVFSSYISRLLRHLISKLAELWQTLDT